MNESEDQTTSTYRYWCGSLDSSHKDDQGYKKGYGQIQVDV